MDRHLRTIGLSAPAILAEDPERLPPDRGFRRRPDGPTPGRPSRRRARLYRLATDVLIEMQAHAPPPGLPDPSTDDWADAAMLCLTEYRAGAIGEPPTLPRCDAALAHALRRWGDGPRVLIHRDYFASNILILPRPGLRRAGLIDFQLGQLGQPVYDLVSLLQDARRDVSPAVEAAMKAHFVSGHPCRQRLRAGLCRLGQPAGPAYPGHLRPTLPQRGPGGIHRPPAPCGTRPQAQPRNTPPSKPSSVTVTAFCPNRPPTS